MMLEQSLDGGAYMAIGGGGASPWSVAGGVIRQVDITDQVVMGAAIPVGTEQLRVVGDLRLEGEFDAIVPLSVADAFKVEDVSANRYIGIDTTIGTETIRFGNTVTNPDIVFEGTGNVTLSSGSSITIGEDITFTQRAVPPNFPLLHNIQGEQPPGDGSFSGDEIRIIAPTGQDNSLGPAGAGGKVRLNSGRGGDCTSGADSGGPGGDLQIFGGFGGSATGAGNFGGTGALVHIQSGNGGSASAGATAAGKGGDILIQAAQGGIGIAVPSGDGGDVTISGGNGGIGAGTDGGFVAIEGGTSGAGGTHGIVSVGALTTSQVNIGDGTNVIAFFAGTGSSQPTIAGSRAGNAALADLLTKLATMGLVVDSTVP
jgi:hypothetical protein